MKNSFIKISGGVVLVIVLVLIYTSAVTQTSGANRKEINIAPATGADTTDIGEPTGDDPWKEFDKLVKAYYVKAGVFYQGTMKLYDGNSDNDKLLEEKKFEYHFFNNEYSYSLDPIEVISKKNYTVIVNHDDKLIAVTPKIASRKKTKDLLSLADFRNILEQQKANIKVTRLGDEKILTVDSVQDPDIQGYRIYYSPQTYKINKILVGMIRMSPLDDESNPDTKKDEANEERTKDPDEDEVDGYVYYLEINYSEVKLLSLKGGEFNPENKFVKIEGKKIELTPEFKGYELFNSDETKN